MDFTDHTPTAEGSFPVVPQFYCQPVASPSAAPSVAASVGAPQFVRQRSMGATLSLEGAMLSLEAAVDDVKVLSEGVLRW